MSGTDDTPVLIVGGGPVGLALAADLGRRGIACVLVEQSDGTIYHPRANTVNSRTMEFCRRWGIAEEVRQAGTPPDFPLDIIYCTGLNGYPLARVERPTYGGHKPLPTTPERSQRCNQLFFDPIMRKLAARFPSVRLRYRCRFESFTEAADGVICQVHDLAANRRETIRARYLVACCAGRSSVPQALGVRWEGQPVLSYHLNVFLKIEELWARHDKGKAAFYFFVDESGGGPSLIELDGRELWRLGISTGQNLIAPEQMDIAAIMKEFVGLGIPYELVSVLPWTCRSIVADTWRRGNVFLAGDAVHQHSPSGGFGMNTGLGDAVDLAWKLAAALDGWGGPALIDSYEIERKPVARRIVREATENQGPIGEAATRALIRAPGAEGDRARALLRDEILRERTRVFVSDGLVLGYHYDPSPVIVPDGTAAPEEAVSKYTPTARPGSRAPHAWLAEGRSTLDLFGDGFALLAFNGAAGDAAPIVAAAQARGVPLKLSAIDDPSIAMLFQRHLVLVRPDGHVCWRDDAPPADPLDLIDRMRGAAN
ncbi:MAG TPA: FAD-dependent monooxygenase [Xanthobacteraceae bacterium]|nr:FAD-dependent monooxygenase [Xanthobacteraceae bacterium]